MVKTDMRQEMRRARLPFASVAAWLGWSKQKLGYRLDNPRPDWNAEIGEAVLQMASLRASTSALIAATVNTRHILETAS